MSLSFSCRASECVAPSTADLWAARADANECTNTSMSSVFNAAFLMMECLVSNPCARSLVLAGFKSELIFSSVRLSPESVQRTSRFINDSAIFRVESHNPECTAEV